MAAGIGIEANDHGCRAFDWSPEATARSNAWYGFVQAFRREHNIPARLLTDEEFSQLDQEFQAMLDLPSVET